MDQSVNKNIAIRSRCSKKNCCKIVLWTENKIYNDRQLILPL